ncbi:hypothetical protein CCACVL1_03168 [Corchorus capsularis]|uniref:Uncharacterized protein n=1 Tax=Corchorus capsularis TaxID=210143 RepID=A0A1R3K1W8_COCAP|nr:hypothetical protein CCACVL1_03168 [Corchorus capsularis]
MEKLSPPTATGAADGKYRQ